MGAGGGKSLASIRLGDDDELFKGGVCCFSLARADRVSGVLGDIVLVVTLPPHNGDTDMANSPKCFKLLVGVVVVVLVTTTLRVVLGESLLLVSEMFRFRLFERFSSELALVFSPEV